MAANLDRAETSLTAVSDIAYIRAIDSSGNSVRISKADLASVLGATSPIFYGAWIGEVSLDNQKTPGRYCCCASESPFIGEGDFRANSTLLLVVEKFRDSTETFYRQTIDRNGTEHLYTRMFWSGQWQSWKKVSYDIPSFYKNYNSLAELKAALAAI